MWENADPQRWWYEWPPLLWKPDLGFYTTQRLGENNWALKLDIVCLNNTYSLGWIFAAHKEKCSIRLFSILRVISGHVTKFWQWHIRKFYILKYLIGEDILVLYFKAICQKLNPYRFSLVSKRHENVITYYIMVIVTYYVMLIMVLTRQSIFIWPQLNPNFWFLNLLSPNFYRFSPND